MSKSKKRKYKQSLKETNEIIEEKTSNYKLATVIMYFSLISFSLFFIASVTLLAIGTKFEDKATANLNSYATSQAKTDNLVVDVEYKIKGKEIQAYFHVRSFTKSAIKYARIEEQITNTKYDLEALDSYGDTLIRFESGDITEPVDLNTLSDLYNIEITDVICE